MISSSLDWVAGAVSALHLGLPPERVSAPALGPAAGAGVALHLGLPPERVSEQGG